MTTTRRRPAPQLRSHGAPRLGRARLLDPPPLDAQALHHACRGTSQAPFNEGEFVRPLYGFDLEVYVEFRPTKMIRRRTSHAGELTHREFAKPRKSTVGDKYLSGAE